MPSNKHILLTIDVEDWFQVENFKPWIPFETWDQCEPRVERNVHRLLDLFDSIELNTQRNEPNKPNQSSQPSPPSSNKQQTIDYLQTKKVKATFFVLGWLADRLPSLVREIQSRGHEVASHGCNHRLPDQISNKELRQELTDSKKLLEDITGCKVAGYRAPSFSINGDNLKTIQDAGYLYDSSYNSFSLHGRYGKISLNGCGRTGIAHKLSGDFYEIPISNLLVYGRVLPWGGGAYFRLIPVSVFNLGIKKILRHQDAYMFYAHPWEFDPEQPKVHQAFFNFRFRHYSNLARTHDRLEGLINKFKNCAFITCREYLSELL